MSLAHPPIDTWVDGIVDAHREQLGERHDRQPSAAFTLLCARTWLDQSDPEFLPYLTDGSGDLGIDLFFTHDPDPSSSTIAVTLFQAKYGKSEGREQKAFPPTEIVKILHAIRVLFDPGRDYTANRRLTDQVEEVRRFLSEGYQPQIRVVACSMGKPWDDEAQRLIDASSATPWGGSTSRPRDCSGCDAGPGRSRRGSLWWAR